MIPGSGAAFSPSRTSVIPPPVPLVTPPPGTPTLYPPSVRFTPGEARAFRPRERDAATGRPLTVSQHADRYRVITEGSHRGPWSTDFAAYTREPMDAWTLPWVRQIILCFGPQSSKTQIALNCLAYAMDQDPGPAMWIVPDEKKAADAANKKILPMLRNSPRLAALLSPRYRDTTERAIRLINGMEILIPWATSAAQLAAESIRYLFFDETDKYPDFSGKEADPISLGEQRVIAYPHTYKILKLSTPSTESGYIWRALSDEADEIRDYHVPCKACGHLQVMRFENITYPREIKDPRTFLRRRDLVHYSCERCGMKWNDKDKRHAVAFGRWIARDPVPDSRPAVIGYHLPRWYSPFTTFAESVAAYLRAQDEPGRMMVFVTQHMAEGYSERIDEEKKESEVLKAHVTTLPARTVPSRAVTLTAGYDSHKDYFKFAVWAWDRDYNHWLIDYGILGTLDDVEAHLFTTRYPVENAPSPDPAPSSAATPSSDTPLTTMAIRRAAVDIGGGKGRDDTMTQTEEIKRWLHRVKRRNTAFAIKGASHRQSRKIQVSLIGAAPKTRRGSHMTGKLELRTLDTDRLKLDLHWRMERQPGQTQCMYFHAQTGEDFVLELLAEEYHRDRKGNTYWKKVRTLNHYLDATIYAHACADLEWLPALLPATGRKYVLGHPDGPEGPAAADSLLTPPPPKPFARQYIPASGPAPRRGFTTNWR